MASSLWVKAIRNHRIDRQTAIPCSRTDPDPALDQACHDLDLPHPLWLDKNQREWDEFGMTRFLPDAFFEPLPCQYIEIEYIDPDAPKRRSSDPRNSF